MIMAKGYQGALDYLGLLYNQTAPTITSLMANAASPLTSMYLALHTADPGELGNSQSTSEIAYTGYARVAIARSSSGFTGVELLLG